MRFLKTVLVLSLVLTVGGSIATAQTRRKKTTRKTTTTKSTTTTVPTTTANVTESEISGGLKDALANGVRFAVDTLGRENGFLNDVRVKIPLPASLQKVEKGLRIAGQGRVVDDFIVSMNRAAEKAVPVAVDVFVDAIKLMSFDDARQILFSGQQDAATQFFRRTSEETLRGKFRPIIEKFTEETGVTNKYKTMIGRYRFAAPVLGKDASDLDGFVTQKALDGLFFMVAEEEKKIRKDPIRRTTTLLQKVFGVLK